MPRLGLGEALRRARGVGRPGARGGLGRLWPLPAGAWCSLSDGGARRVRRVPPRHRRDGPVCWRESG